MCGVGSCDHGIAGVFNAYRLQKLEVVAVEQIGRALSASLGYMMLMVWLSFLWTDYRTNNVLWCAS